MKKDEEKELTLLAYKSIIKERLKKNLNKL